MPTNGVVWALALSCAFSGVARAMEEEPQPQAAAPPSVSSTDEILNQDRYVTNDVTYVSCDPPWHGPHLYAGTEFSALRIHSRTGGTTTASFSDTTAPGVSTRAFRERNGVDDWGFAPRIWLGAEILEGWSIQGRYWRLSDSDEHVPNANPAIANVGTNFATFEETDFVNASIADAEGMKSWQWGKWKADAFVGGRHAELRSESDFLGFGVFTTGNFVNLILQNGIDFDGAGVTYGGTLRRQIGNSHSFVYCTARGSELEGHTTSFARADGAIASSPSAPLVGAATVTRADADARMYIFELQGGWEYEQSLAFCPANFFFRVGYELQRWDIDGLPTGGAGFGGTIGEITTNSFASADARKAGLVVEGVTLGTGLTW